MKRVSRIVFIILPLFFGILVALEEYFMFLSIKKINVYSSDFAIEDKIWIALDGNMLRFAPAMLLKWNAKQRLLEEELPVYISTKWTSGKTMQIREKPRILWMILGWQGGKWYLSEDGGIWSASHPANRSMLFSVASVDVQWDISDAIPSPVQGESPRNDRVYRSSLPLDFLRYCRNSFNSSAWYHSVEKLTLDRRAGRFLFRIVLKKDGRVVDVLVDGDVRTLNERNVAIEHVLRTIPETTKKSIIDATYQDKIVVKFLSDDLRP
ncbi:MAG: hypothetical protein ABFD50_10670 [Smithella sp.]